MASVVKIKRSSVQGKAPTASDITAGEIALNTRDGKLFSSDGTAVFEVGANLHSLSVGTGGISVGNGAFTLPSSDGVADQILVTDGNGVVQWRNQSGGSYLAFRQYSYIAANNQLTFTGTDKFGSTLGYVEDKISVYLNGAKLLANTDYTATNGTSIVLSANTAQYDVLDIQTYTGVSGFVSVDAAIVANTVTHTSATQVVADSFFKTSFRSAKYIIQAEDTDHNNKYQVTELLLIHNGSSTFTTEYGTVASSTSIVSIDSDVSGNDVRLLITPTSTNTKIKITRTSIVV